jgi:hypothetical protein
LLYLLYETTPKANFAFGVVSLVEKFKSSDGP